VISYLRDAGEPPTKLFCSKSKETGPFCEGSVLLWHQGIASLQCLGPDMHSMDGRQRGVGGLLPAVNDECNVFWIFCLSPEQKGPDDAAIWTKELVGDGVIAIADPIYGSNAVLGRFHLLQFAAQVLDMRVYGPVGDNAFVVIKGV
jgi:hypothetical protein